MEREEFHYRFQWEDGCGTVWERLLSRPSLTEFSSPSATRVIPSKKQCKGAFWVDTHSVFQALETDCYQGEKSNEDMERKDSLNR